MRRRSSLKVIAANCRRISLKLLRQPNSWSTFSPSTRSSSASGMRPSASLSQVLERLAVGAVALDVGHVGAPYQPLGADAAVQRLHRRPKLGERVLVGPRPMDWVGCTRLRSLITPLRPRTLRCAESGGGAGPPRSEAQGPFPGTPPVRAVRGCDRQMAAFLKPGLVCGAGGTRAGREHPRLRWVLPTSGHTRRTGRA